MGVHGAGLVNAVFARPQATVLELKTLYGYSTDIFVRVADSRNGTHVHIDIRAYSTPQQVHVADHSLAQRVVHGLEQALKYNARAQREPIERISSQHEDYIIGPVTRMGYNGYVLGPPATTVKEYCEKHLPYFQYRQSYLKGDKLEYCGGCGED